MGHGRAHPLRRSRDRAASVYLLEDGRSGPARLLRLEPKKR